MTELPEGFDAEPCEPLGADEGGTPATVLTSPDGTLFGVVGNNDKYVGCLIRSDKMVEGYYRIPDAEGGLTEALEPFYSAGWDH